VGSGRSEEAVAFHRAVVRYAEEQSDELAAALRDFLRQLRRWRDLARQRPLAELIWEIYDQTGYLAFCEGLANGAQRVANLIYLHERAAQFGSFTRQGLYRFLKFLDSLEAETDFGQPSVLSSAADVVRVMSIHMSKGLEFPVVFLPEMGKRINLQDCQGAILIDKEKGLGMSAIDERLRARYPSLASVLVRQSLRKQSLAEELRVLYVATTRAKEHLILSGTCGDNKCEGWQTRWAGHAGAMPAEDVLAATTMLDWIGPAAAMIGGDAAFAVTRHSPEEVAGWTAAERRRPGLSTEQERLARLEPLTPGPAPDGRADELIRALTTPYPHAAASKSEAARSVTDWTKRGRAAPAGYASNESSPGGGPSALKFERTLETPRCLLAKNELSAADVGTATHIVLQHLDFTRPCVDDDLALQVNDLVSRRLLTKAQAKHVDLGAVEWFASTPLARRMASAGDRLLRELDFHLAVAPDEFPGGAASDDPADQVMIRGRIDALLVDESGRLTVVDYKTDRVDTEAVAARAAFYAPQVRLYRRAMERLTPRAVEAVHLVFLGARRVVTL
jgi:ATP-dependent helicase/nuclease subunit A